MHQKISKFLISQSGIRMNQDFEAHTPEQFHVLTGFVTQTERVLHVL